MFIVEVSGGWTRYVISLDSAPMFCDPCITWTFNQINNIFFCLASYTFNNNWFVVDGVYKAFCILGMLAGNAATTFKVSCQTMWNCFWNTVILIGFYNFVFYIFSPFKCNHRKICKNPLKVWF